MKHSIHTFLLSLLLALAACSAPTDPNILIYLTDDLGYGDLGCYGNPIIQSPHLDELARSGVRFTDFHSAGTVCSPSRASLLTGRHPYRLGFYYILGGGAHLTKDEITLPNLLKTKDYQTFFAGKWHLTHFDRPAAGQPSPADHGFDHWFATVLNAFDGPESPAKFYRNGTPVGELNDWYINLITDEAITWIRNRDPEKPFFMQISTHGPHTPVNPPASYAEAYDNAAVNELEKNISYGFVERPADRDIQDQKKYYYGTVTQIDEAFGRLMTALREMDVADNTLILFTSDNGPEYPVNFMESKGQWEDPIRDRCFGTPGDLRGMKRFTYEGGHRVPTIISWPSRIRSQQTSDVLLNATDILPTICALTGIDPPADRTIDGEIMLDAFLGKKQERQHQVVWNAPVHEYTFVPSMTLREGPWMLVAWFNQKPEEQRWMDWIKTARPETWELYRVDQDPGQQNDLSQTETEKLDELIPKLTDIWTDIQNEAPYHENWKAK